MAVAYSALANKGILMKPYIIEEIETENGEITTTEPKTVQRVIDEETADTITSMMVSAIENGVAKNARVAGHYIAGKTGTSQTYKNGKPLEGPGTTIASIAGFAPADDPKFVILIKVDRPRTQVWADSTVAPMFAEISQFLFKYYAIAQDKT
jgi:cell division protein FtsI/penicillin-binding protein 2